MTPEQVIARSHRWRAFYEEQGGIRDMFGHVRETYLARLAEIASKEPWATDKIVNLSVAQRIVSEVEGLVQAMIADGAVAEANKAHVEKIEKLPHAKRRFL